MSKKKSKLNARQKRFVTEYLIDMNATQAAIRAGYSKKTAYSQGQRLLKHVEIKSQLLKKKQEIQDKNIATIKDIEEFLSLSMMGEIEEEVLLTVGSGDGYSEVVKEKKEISVRDRIKAAELLGKRHAMFTEKVQQDLDMNLTVSIDYGDEDGED